jgi:hypothetical protein
MERGDVGNDRGRKRRGEDKHIPRARNRSSDRIAIAFTRSTQTKSQMLAICAHMNKRDDIEDF